jgi:hypothetical protein
MLFSRIFYSNLAVLPEHTAGVSPNFTPMEHFNQDPVVHTWSYKLDKAA